MQKLKFYKSFEHYVLVLGIISLILVSILLYYWSQGYSIYIKDSVGYIVKYVPSVTEGDTVLFQNKYDVLFAEVQSVLLPGAQGTYRLSIQNNILDVDTARVLGKLVYSSYNIYLLPKLLNLWLAFIIISCSFWFLAGLIIEKIERSPYNGVYLSSV